MLYDTHSLSKLKVALVHDWLPLIGGAERVLEQFTKIFPLAEIFTLFDFLTPQQKAIFGGCKIHTSGLNKLPYVEKYYRHLLAFCPQAIEAFDLSEFDLIISSSAALAKGVITRPYQKHFAYVHSPARYAWDLTHKYLRDSHLDRGIKGYIAQNMLHKFRIWDMRTPNGVDKFIANSGFIAKRINRTYRRSAEVIYPPVNIEQFSFSANKKEYYLTASRLVGYKKIDVIARAFASMPDKNLIIIGSGPDENKIREIAFSAHNIQCLGYQDTKSMKEYMQYAKAFVFAAEEDFGIIPLEAQACGTPVIAFGKGGALETVIGYDGTNDALATGIFFDEQTPEAIENAVERFSQIASKIHPQNCRHNAEKFSNDVFKNKVIASIIDMYHKGHVI
jgi:glycosyltransferase involved in cell wall biosynthesis